MDSEKQINHHSKYVKLKVHRLSSKLTENFITPKFPNSYIMI